MYSNQIHKLLGKYNKVLGSKYDRGHLAPAGTLSSTMEGYLSTYTYTNAVPQYKGFNSGDWNVFEELIRKYAKQCILKPGRGTLYLLTGTSFTTFSTDGVIDNKLAIKTLLNKGDKSDISIPNSLWTAGCCVYANGAESFAVIGKNDQIPKLQEIKLAKLEEILRADVGNEGLGIGGPAVKLFPGNENCLAYSTRFFHFSKKWKK